MTKQIKEQLQGGKDKMEDKEQKKQDVEDWVEKLKENGQEEFLANLTINC